jgi:hypothetical protein
MRISKSRPHLNVIVARRKWEGKSGNCKALWRGAAEKTILRVTSF